MALNRARALLVASYAECGCWYWLHHVCGFQPPLAPELGFGRFLHHVVAELARRAMAGLVRREEGRIPGRPGLLPPHGRPVPAENLRRSAVRRLRAYVRRFGEELRRAIRPEARFEVPLEVARIAGWIDLLLRASPEEGGGGPEADRRVELIDFETSANRAPPPTCTETSSGWDASAAERPGLEPVALAIHDVDADDGGRVEVPRDERERERFREWLQGWEEGIRAQVFEPPRDLAVCAACDFRRFCRYAPASVRAMR
ncbi:MAG TPA: PD-(D/E)XK nuclease family protein [Actinomycetota bacterium]|nr:PD-(D/E)XK nuclease family protein [Actinomycetota bacterium]